jgi:hypothetical protein
MAMQIGDLSAGSGMTKAIYDQIAANLEPDLAPLEEKDRVPVREGWKKLAHAIATGVVNHIQANLQIRNLAGSAAPELQVGGDTAAADPAANHTHAAGTLSVTINDVVFR